MSVFLKDPSEVIDWTFDYNDSTAGPLLVGGETISTSSWSADTGITVDSDTNDTTTTTVTLSGGTARGIYRIANTVTTSASRTYERTLVVRVENR